MISQLAVYERSCCSCRQCVGFCKAGKPGALAPGQIDSIAEYLGTTATEEFLAATFEATEDGPRAACQEYADGTTPAIRPKTRLDGSCIFLSDEGRCTINPVKPFECLMTKACDPTEGGAAMKALGRVNAASIDAVNLWLWLKERQTT